MYNLTIIIFIKKIGLKTFLEILELRQNVTTCELDKRIKGFLKKPKEDFLSQKVDCPKPPLR